MDKWSIGETTLMHGSKGVASIIAPRELKDRIVRLLNEAEPHQGDKDASGGQGVNGVASATSSSACSACSLLSRARALIINFGWLRS